MDAAVREVLASVIRDEVRVVMAPDFDRLIAELRDLHRRLVAVERELGLEVMPLGAHERRERVLELRRRGHSARQIAKLLGVDRGTVLRDFRATGVVIDGRVIGTDGRAYRAADGRRNGHVASGP